MKDRKYHRLLRRALERQTWQGHTTLPVQGYTPPKGEPTPKAKRRLIKWGGRVLGSVMVKR
jgi:hypothetical protein